MKYKKNYYRQSKSKSHNFISDQQMYNMNILTTLRTRSINKTNVVRKNSFDEYITDQK